jgi:hypothetical protein
MTLKRVYTSPRMIMYYQGSLKDFAEIAMSPRILAICLEIASEEALPIAISLSRSHVHDGTYIRSWRVKPTTVMLRGMRRVCARLINEAPHSALIEWGGKPSGGRYKGRYRPAYHILQHVREQLAGRNRIDPDLAEGLNT